jgi:alcohol dehydrogenase class IV
MFRLLALFVDWRKPERLEGFPALAELLRENGVETVLVVTGAGLVRRGAHTELVKALGDKNVKFALYDKTVPNPAVENIEEAFATYKSEKCSAIIALGGGSSIDCAKGAGARAARPGKTIPQMRGQLKVGKTPPLLIAVPTTAGSGSEATLSASVTDGSTREKYAVIDPVLIPRYVLLEPELTASLPPPMTAGTGMDALCHAVEAYIGRSNTRQTKKDALKATELIFGNLYKAYSDGSDLTARKNMQEAAFLAGTAFTRAYVGNIHAAAHTLGGKYGTAHGTANAVIMPYVLEAYGGRVHAALSELAIAAGIAGRDGSKKENAKKFIAAIREMNGKMGLPEKIAGLKEADIPALAELALKEANPLYPVPVIFGKAEMEKVYRDILEV